MVGSSLANFATFAHASRGRLVAEPPSQTRGVYQRDRDRIIHSSAFRRLRNKTQVFIESEGDYFRTRLTHSLEVAQIARVLARALAVDEDLAEALALAHDLGHTCFGHAGEQALREAMQEHSISLPGFDHNDQTLRILTQLERRYAGFNGLNLSWEMLEGVVKHNGPLVGADILKAIPPTIAAFNKVWDLELQSFAGIEAQLAALSDDIAYNTHDFDDGVRAGLFSLEELATLPIFAPVIKTLHQQHPGLEPDRMSHEIIRAVIGILVEDVLAETRHRLHQAKPDGAAAVRSAGIPLVAFSPEIEAGITQLRQFLHQHMYRHTKVNRMTSRARRMVKRLFGYFMAEPNVLPQEWYQALVVRDALQDEAAKARHIADYIAGMTDRYAELEYRRLFSSNFSHDTVLA